MAYDIDICIYTITILFVTYGRQIHPRHRICRYAKTIFDVVSLCAPTEYFD